MKLRSHTPALRRLADETLHATDPQDLARLLTQALPAALELDKATLLLWDRKVETFEGLSLGEGGFHPVGPGDGVGSALPTRATWWRTGKSWRPRARETAPSCP